MSRVYTLVFHLMFEPLLVIYAVFQALGSRYKKKTYDIGLGPDPLINNVYHKKALIQQGYSVQTFVTHTYYITKDFDIDLSTKNKILRYFSLINLAFEHKVLFFYFNGGPLSFFKFFKIEPWLYKIAKVKTVVMPYGSDIQEMSRSQNLLFKHVLSIDYKNHRLRRNKIASNIDLWTKHADYIISGCEWVDYMYYWDELMSGHFSIDINNTKFCANNGRRSGSFKIFHSPNHQAIKGTKFLVQAIDELKEDGLDIELVMKTKISNDEVIATIHECDLVADQFIVGWYAMFSLEAMACKKPVLCFLREDLIGLYKQAEVLTQKIPIINTKVDKIKETILWCYDNRKELEEIGTESYRFVEKYHSLEVMGEKFSQIIRKIEKEI